MPSQGCYGLEFAAAAVATLLLQPGPGDCGRRSAAAVPAVSFRRAEPSGHASARHVRTRAHGRLDAGALLADALDRSETVRRLVAELEASDVRVWIQLRECPTAGMSGCLR